jgi:hypothetical protein
MVEQQLLKRGLIGEDDLRLYKITDDLEEAVEEVVHFYSNYHSVRYVKDELILRLQRKPTQEQLEEINEKFKDILVKGEFKVSGPLAAERDEPTLAHLHRLTFHFNKRDHGRLRILIDYLNDLGE